MHQLFSFKRFTLLVAKHWAEHKRRYTLAVPAFIGLLIIWFLFTLFTVEEAPMGVGVQQSTYFFSLFAVGTFYAGQYFSELSPRAKGSHFLLVPASTLEKLLCGLLYTVLLFFVVLTAAFYLVDALLVTLFNSFYAERAAVPKVGLVNVFDAHLLLFSNGTTINLLLFFFSVQSAFLLGSVSFKKYPFIKTILSGFVVWLILSGLFFIFYRQLLHGGANLVQIPWVVQLFSIVVMYALAPLFWVLTYGRLKRKQV